MVHVVGRNGDERVHWSGSLLGIVRGRRHGRWSVAWAEGDLLVERPQPADLLLNSGETRLELLVHLVELDDVVGCYGIRKRALDILTPSADKGLEMNKPRSRRETLLFF